MTLLDNNKKGGRLILGLALLFLFSCEDDSTFGLPFDPNDENIRIFEKEFILPTAVVLLDSVRTSSSRILTGTHQNETLGTVTATAFTSFGRTSTSIPTDATYDSAVLVLNVDYWYGLTSTPATSGLSVHLLQEPLIEVGRIDTLEDGNLDSVYINKVFYSKDKVPFAMESIGQVTFPVDPEKESNEVHVMLDNDFGTDLFTKIKGENEAVENNEKLQLYFKGIALVSTDGTPHMLGFDHEETKIHLYHHTSSADSLQYTLDTSVANWFTNFEADRSGTSLAGLTEPLQDFNPGDDKVYLQSGAGVVPKINFAPFIDFINSTGEKVVINQAEFSIEIDFPGESSPPPSGLQPFLVKEDNKLILTGFDQNRRPIYKTLRNELTQNDLVLLPDTVENTNTIAYRGVITNYTESLLDGGDIEEDFLLYPAQLGSSVNHLLTDSSRVKLKIHYTTLK